MEHLGWPPMVAFGLRIRAAVGNDMRIPPCCLCVFAVLLWAGQMACADVVELHNPCGRIVSLAPSITETLFSLGLGKRIVGVTAFDRYPPEVQEIRRVGGALDASPELVFALKPQLVVLLEEMHVLSDQLERIGLRTVRVDHRSVAGLLQSFGALGELCGIKAAAGALLAEKERAIDQLRQVAAKSRPRVLVTIAGSSNPADVSSLYISGSDGYYSELLGMLGAENALHSGTVPMGTLSVEGVIALKPDYIFEIFERPISESDWNARRGAWERFSVIPAVAHRRLYRFDQDFASIPGPRFDQLLGEFARVLTVNS